MKIVHICFSAPYMDGWGYQENLLPYYQYKLGHDVTVLASTVYPDYFKPKEEDLQEREYVYEGVHVIRMKPRINIKNRIQKFPGLYINLEKLNPDLLYLHGGLCFDSNVIAKYIKRHPQTKLTVDFHAEFGNSAMTWISKKILHKVIWKQNIKLLLPYTQNIYCITEGVMKFVHDMYNLPYDRLRLLPLCAQMENVLAAESSGTRTRIRDELNIADNIILIVHGGKFGNKGTLELINVVKNLSSNVHLLIFGEGKGEYQKKVEKAVEGQERIHYVGWIPSDKVYEYYIASDLACFPGEHSVIWQQAIACGLPLICKYTFGDDYLDIGGNILFIKDGKESTIEVAIQSLLNDTNRLQNMALVAKTKGREYFSYERIARSVINDAIS